MLWNHTSLFVVPWTHGLIHDLNFVKARVFDKGVMAEVVNGAWQGMKQMNFHTQMV